MLEVEHGDQRLLLGRVQEDELLANTALDGRAADDSWATESDAGHFSQWNPWRVQSACVTRRLLVRAHRSMASTDHATLVCRTCRGEDGLPAAWPCYTLKVVASEWSHHPDYRDEWRPIRRAAGHSVRGGTQVVSARRQAPGQRGA